MLYKPICWLVEKIPNRLLAEPERFTLALCFSVIGIDAVFFGAPSSVLGQAPKAELYNLETGLAFLFGGVLKLVGLWTKNVWCVRLGAAFLIMACIGLVFGIHLYGDEGDEPVAIVYILFGITYSLRLLSSTAERIKLHQKGRKE